MTNDQQIKAPQDHLDYTIDFERWLPDGDTIASAIASISPSGDATISLTTVATPRVRVWIQGGTDGASYDVYVDATTTAGRVKRDCFTLKVRNC